MIDISLKGHLTIINSAYATNNLWLHIYFFSWQRSAENIARITQSDGWIWPDC